MLTAHPGVERTGEVKLSKSALAKVWDSLFRKNKALVECYLLISLDSGRLEIVLAEHANYEDFNRISKKWNKKMGGGIKEKIDSPFERLWIASIGGTLFTLFWEGMDRRVVIMSKDQNEDEKTRKLFESFR